MSGCGGLVHIAYDGMAQRVDQQLVFDGGQLIIWLFKISINKHFVYPQAVGLTNLKLPEIYKPILFLVHSPLLFLTVINVSM